MRCPKSAAVFEPIPSETIPSLVGVGSTFKAKFLIFPKSLSMMEFRLPVPGQGPACGHRRWCSCRPPGRKGWVSHLDRRQSWAAENGCRENDLWPNTDTESPTWSKCLGVTNANKAVVINFSLRREKKTTSRSVAAIPISSERLSCYLRWRRRPCPAGTWRRCRSVYCCCRQSRPGSPRSPACHSPSDRWSRRIQLHRCLKQKNKMGEKVISEEAFRNSINI